MARTKPLELLSPKYRQRILAGMAKGYSRSQARGHPGKKERHIKPEKAKQETQADAKYIRQKALDRLTQEIEVHGTYTTFKAGIEQVHTRIIRFSAKEPEGSHRKLSLGSAATYNRLLDKYGYKTATVWLLSEVYKVPSLTGVGEWIEPGTDEWSDVYPDFRSYDDRNFDGFDEDDTTSYFVWWK